MCSNFFKHSLYRVFIFLIAGAALVACDDASNEVKNIEQLLQRASEKRAEGKLRATIIDLKTVLQKDSKNAEARLMLGQVYLDTGDGESAEKEADQAQKLGGARLAIYDILGNAWLLQNKPGVLLEKIAHGAGSSAAMRTKSYEFRGEAQRILGNLDEAKKEFDLALIEYRKDINEERPHLKLTEPAESVRALVGLTKIAITETAQDVAQSRLDRALAVAPDKTEVIAVKGLFHFERKNFAAAEEAYKAAFKAAPYHAGYQLRIAHSQVAQKKYEEAIELLDSLIKAFPASILSNYLRALAAYQLGNYEDAKSYTDNIFKIRSDHLPSFLVAGSASYALGQLEQANRMLGRYVAAVPQNTAARKLLSAAQLKLGRPGEAIVTLRPITNTESEDASLLSLIGTAAVGTGDLDSGYQYFRKAALRRPDDVSLQAKTAYIQIAKGDTDSGLKSLEDVISRDPSLVRFEVELILTYIKEKKFDEAVSAARRLQERHPEERTGFTLEGLTEFTRKDNARAKDSFKKALSARPGDPTASHNLALLYISERQPESAQETYKAVFEQFPNDETTLFRLARLEGQV